MRKGLFMSCETRLETLEVKGMYCYQFCSIVAVSYSLCVHNSNLKDLHY